VSAVARTLDVARSQINERRDRTVKPRGPYRKAGDAEFLAPILFVLDACDREIIAWSAVAQSGISAEMVRDLMVTAVERRFGTTKVQQPVEWLSDNGSAYIAKDTADTARALGRRCSSRPSAARSRTACRKPSLKR